MYIICWIDKKAQLLRMCCRQHCSIHLRTFLPTPLIWLMTNFHYCIFYCFDFVSGFRGLGYVREYNMRVMTFSNNTGEQSRDSMLCLPPDTTGNVSLTTKMKLREDCKKSSQWNQWKTGSLSSIRYKGSATKHTWHEHTRGDGSGVLS